MLWSFQRCVVKVRSLTGETIHQWMFWFKNIYLLIPVQNHENFCCELSLIFLPDTDQFRVLAVDNLFNCPLHGVIISQAQLVQKLFRESVRACNREEKLKNEFTAQIWSWEIVSLFGFEGKSKEKLWARSLSGDGMLCLCSHDSNFKINVFGRLDVDLTTALHSSRTNCLKHNFPRRTEWLTVENGQRAFRVAGCDSTVVISIRVTKQWAGVDWIELASQWMSCLIAIHYMYRAKDFFRK